MAVVSVAQKTKSYFIFRMVLFRMVISRMDISYLEWISTLKCDAT